ncbi:MAG: peptidyl-prolyl cis-trans isomerase [Polyangia bacterium]
MSVSRSLRPGRPGARRRLVLAAALSLGCLSASTLGCRDVAKAGDKKEGVLAQVDDVVITVREFQDRINAQSPYVRARYASLDHKKEFLENLVKFELLAAEAKRQGLDQDPEVVRTVKQVMIQRLLRQKFDAMKAEDIPETDIKAYFDGHQDEFNRPPEVRVSMILVPDEATAKKVQADPRLLGLENVGFRDLVAQYSVDAETKERGGDLRFFDDHNRELPPEIVQAAFKLQSMGEVSPPVKTARGYAILKLTGQRKALVRTLPEVAQQIRAKLFRERRQRLLDDYERGLRQKARVEIHEQRLATVKVDLSNDVGAPESLRPVPGTGDFHPGGQAVPQVSPDKPAPPATK